MHPMTLLLEGAPKSLPIIIFLTGLLLLYLGRKSLRDAKIVSRLPETPIRAIARGMVNIFGRVEGDEPLTSPIAGVPCFWFSAKAEKLVGEGAHQRWTSLKNLTAQRNFYINDGTSRILVDPQGAEFDLPLTLEATMKPESGHTCKLDPAIGLSEPAEDRLRAILLADWQANGGRPNMELPAAKTVEESPEKKKWWRPESISVEIEGFGEIALREESKGYRLLETCLVAGHEYSIIGTCDQDPNLQDGQAARIARSTSANTFVISSKMGGQLAKSLRLRGILMIAGGVLLIVGAVLLWHFRDNFETAVGEPLQPVECITSAQLARDSGGLC